VDLATKYLEQLFSLNGLEDFLVRFWPSHSTVVHGPLERFGALASLASLSDLGSLVEVFKDPVMVILPEERDESSAIKVDGLAALSHYRDGLALCFESVDKFIPEVQVWLQGIRQELGLPSATFARALVYAAKPGAGNKPHYDANANIVVQLRGTKRWTIAPNRHIVHPIDRWTMTSEYLPPEPREDDGPMPRKMPDGAQVIDLTPGSVMLLPRGFWHATEVSSDDTLALNFTYSQPTWAEVMTASLLNRLHRDSSFRALADGLESIDPARADAAKVQLAQMLELFKSEVRSVEVKDLLAELLA
jgi:50S ribosomal protein L16 3-hydroxylase